jgi:hypothetical protein
LRQPSNQLASEPDLADVFPKSDRIVDRFRRPRSRDRRRQTAVRRKSAVHGHPTEANALESGTWRLELLVCGDNIKPERSFVTLAFDGIWPQAGAEQRHLGTLRGPRTLARNRQDAGRCNASCRTTPLTRRRRHRWSQQADRLGHETAVVS